MWLTSSGAASAASVASNPPPEWPTRTHFSGPPGCNAETFDITRDKAQSQNLGLGYGIHSCLGAALARLETSVALEHLLDFMPRYELDFAGLHRVTMQNVAGYHNVPVRVLK